MTYEEVRDYIANKCTQGSVYDLDCIKQVLKLLNSPEKDCKIIHIAGTNGKGSISRMLMQILKEAGYTVGIFNSPFLLKRNEYLCVNGIDASDDEYSLIAGIVKNAVERNYGQTGSVLKRRPTEFEYSFAMAMEYFSRKQCDFAIVECGLGGKSDATNVFTEKELSIIANIGLDHVKLLGNTLKEIAGQKSGIIIKNDTVIAYPSEPEAIKKIKAVCKKNDAKLITPDFIKFGSMSYYNPGFSDEDMKEMKSPDMEKFFVNMPYFMNSIALNGDFQKRNGMVVFAAVMYLKSKGYKITFKSVLKGFENVRWPGRYETLCKDPLIIADGGHNEQCIKALCDSLINDNISKAIFVIGVMADKDYKTMFDILKPFALYVFATEPENPRRLDASEIIREFAERYVEGKAVPDPVIAATEAVEYKKNLNNKNIPVIIVGSLYMIGKIRQKITGGLERDEN